MASLYQCLSRHHARRTTTDHHDFLSFIFRYWLNLSAHTTARINGTAHIGAPCIGIAAKIAPSARTDFFLLPLQRLSDNIAVRHKAFGHGHNICLTCGNNLFCLFQSCDHPHNSHRHMQMFLYFCCIIHIQRFVRFTKICRYTITRRQMKNRTLRYMDDIHILLGFFHKCQRFLKFHAARNTFHSRNSHLNDHIFTDSFSHCLQHFQWVSTPVLR